MKIKVKNCHECPFSNNDNEYGRDTCNLAVYLEIEIHLGHWEGLPEDKVHDKCPLRNIKNLNVKLNQITK